MGQEIRSAVSDVPRDFSFAGGSAETLSGEKTPLTSARLAAEMIHADVIIDFSSPKGAEILWKALSHKSLQGVAVLVGTTGLSTSQIEKWSKTALKSKLKVLFAPNTSLGVLAALHGARLIEEFTRGRGFDIEIVETHHNRKKDSPSGTAKFLAENLASQSGAHLRVARTGARAKGEIGISSVRGGGVFGEHEVRFLEIGRASCRERVYVLV